MTYSPIVESQYYSAPIEDENGNLVAIKLTREVKTTPRSKSGSMLYSRTETVRARDFLSKVLAH